ncbi:hypothetical protein VCHA53O466_50060 [Vibrio chagasii]|nr:hypothetical protein VCHA53O466_50060 [Vibrio chagasii]
MKIVKPYPKYIGTYNKEKDTCGCFKRVGGSEEPIYENKNGRIVHFTPNGFLNDEKGRPTFLGHKAVVGNLDFSHFKSPSETKEAVKAHLRLINETNYPELTARLQAQEESIEIAHSMVDKFIDELENTKTLVLTKLSVELDVSPSELHMGIQHCNESPVKICVYNESEDPAHDDCIFCGEPSERK